MIDVCRNCDHRFYDRHLEDDRRDPTPREQARRRCDDCLDCNPPEDAPVREHDLHREVAPA